MTVSSAELTQAAYGDSPEKVAAALGRFTVEEVTDPTAFDAGYRLLDAQFGPVNEIERREILERWSSEGSLSPEGPGMRPRYHMLLFRDRDGRLAAVRDGFTAIDVDAKRVVAFMSHSLVIPEARRTGVAALLRAAPAVYARQLAVESGVPDAELLLVAEMEPVVPGATPSLVRYLSYGRAGFRVVPPEWAPYAQPDFRDLDQLGVPALPVPMMLVVRQVGHEDRTHLAWTDLTAILDCLAAVHMHSVHPAQLPEIRANTLRYRPAGDQPRIPLIDPHDAKDLVPLLRSAVLAHHPEAWHGRPAGDPAEERRALLEDWDDSTPGST